MSSKASSSKAPLKAVDPKPMSEVAGERYVPSEPQPPPQSHQYRPQDYAPQHYNPPDFLPDPATPGKSSQPGRQDHTTKPYNPADYPPVSSSQQIQAQRPTSAMAFRPASDSRVPLYAGNMADMPQSNAPMITAGPDIRNVKASCQFNMREYLSLQRQRHGQSGASAYNLETRIRTQTAVVTQDLKSLQAEIRSLVKKAERNRWSRVLIGGAIASFIPIVRKFFRRKDDAESKESSNDTEYAFRKSQGLIDHIKDGVLGSGKFAKIAFLVVAVLYVFSNEVTVRVAKTTHKRIKKLCARIEGGDPEVNEKDMKVLEGWRWRVMLW